MVGIHGGAVSSNLGKDVRSTRLCVLERFQHQHAPAFGNHESIAPRIERATGRGWIVVAGAEQRIIANAPNVSGARVLGRRPPASACPAVLDQTRRLTDRDQPGRTRIAVGE